MNPGVPQIMLGLLLIVAGVLTIKVLNNDLGWAVFFLGAAVGCRGAIAISASGQKELSN